MKKIIALILTLVLILPFSIFLSDDTFKDKGKEVTREQAIRFADELRELAGEASLRLIVNSNKQIDYLDAIDIATGIDDLYVLQFDNESSVKMAEEYYNSLSYVNYVEYDYEAENILCEVEDDFDFFPQCVSTVNSNIDDAIKLMHKENIKMFEIKVGVIDSGIAVTSFTKNRIDGGYSYIEGFSSDGTQDMRGHGTKVAGTIIQNTLDNVRLYSYQIMDGNGSATLSRATSAIYLGVSEGCKILNCSFRLEMEISTNINSITSAVNYATQQGCIVVAGAGNDSKPLKETHNYPALIDNAITVGAMDQNKRLSVFSNYGKGIDIYATGEGMTSYDNEGNVFSNWSGTSAATPVISSICALLIMTKPNITINEIKELLLETGTATNENNQNDSHRIIADAYECIKKLTGCKLEQAQFNYAITKNDKTNCSNLSFSCDNENATIFYFQGLGGTLEIPYRESLGNSFYKYEQGEILNMSQWQLITACAYAPGKAKYVQYFQVPIDYENGYLFEKATATKQYNSVRRCQFINQKVIEVPKVIDGYEIQEIGRYCFMGNPTVETIILPETVKEIGYYAFANCPNLKTVIAPGVEFCDKYVFYLCDSLVNVEMPHLTQANTGLFKNCKSLETAKLGTLTEIDNHAFYGCQNLKLVKTTADAISFSARTFYNCNALTICTPKDSSMYRFAIDNNIPVVTSIDELEHNYKFAGEKNGILTYTSEYMESVTYDIQTVYAMWDVKYINKPADEFADGYMLDLTNDGIINAKDYSMLVKINNRQVSYNNIT